MDATSSVCEYLGGGSLAGLNCRRCAQELAALVEHAYSMTWSARRRSDCGIVRPSAFAMLKHRQPYNPSRLLVAPATIGS